MKFLLSVFLAASVQDVSIDRLMRGWRFEDPAVREAATDVILSRWQSWSDADLAKVVAVAGDDDAEVSAQARFVVARIRLRKRLGVDVLQAIPGIDSVLDGGSAARRFEALQGAARLWKRKKLGRASLERIGRIAAEGSWNRSAYDLIVFCRAQKVDPWGPLLASFLSHPDREVRSNAADTIGFLGLKEHAAALVPLLADEEGDLHWEVADALFMLEAHDQVPGVFPFLSHDSPGVRENAVRLLGQMGIPSAVPVAANLLDDPSRSVRLETVRALGKLRAAKYADRVVPYLLDAHPEARRIAVTALGHMRAGNLADRMVPLLEDAEANVRLEATYALGTLRRPEHGPALASRLKDSDANVREAAAKALGRLRERSHAEAVAACLDDPVDAVRISAVETLAELGAKKYAPRMVPFLSHELYTYRLAALESIRKVDAWNFSEKLLPCLKDSKAVVRRKTVEVLGSLGSEHAAALVPLLEDPEFIVQGRAWNELEQVASWETLKQVLPLLKHEKVMVRVGAAFVICLRVTPDRAAILLPLLEDPEENIRIHALEALGRIGSREHLGALRAGLRDEDEFVRASAAIGLAHLGRRVLPEEGRRAALKPLEDFRTDIPTIGRWIRINLLALGRLDRIESRMLLESYGNEPGRISDPSILLDALARAYEPTAYGRLNETLVADERVSSQEKLVRLFAGASLRLQVSDKRFFIRRLPAGTRITVGRALDRCFDEQAAVVLNGKTVKVLSRLEALDHWKKKLDED